MNVDPGRRASNVKSNLTDLAILLGLVALGTAALFTPTLMGLGAVIQMDAGDSLLNLLFLENGYQHLWGGQHWLDWHHWLNPGYLYPYHHVLAWSEHSFLPSLLYGLFRHCTGPVAAYGLWMMATAALNFLVFTAVLRRFVRRPIALVLAFASCYGVMQLSQLGHSQLLSQYCLAPSLAAAFDLGMVVLPLDRDQWPNRGKNLGMNLGTNPGMKCRAAAPIACDCCLGIVGTFLCSYYLFYGLLLSIAALAMGFVVWAFVLGRSDRLRPRDPGPNPASAEMRRASQPVGFPGQRLGLLARVALLGALLIPAQSLLWAYLESYRLHGGRNPTMYGMERPDSFQPWLTTTFQSGDLLLQPPIPWQSLRGDVANLAENGLFNGYIYILLFFLALAIVLGSLLKRWLAWQQVSGLVRAAPPDQCRQGSSSQQLFASTLFFFSSLAIGLLIFELHDRGLWLSVVSHWPGAGALRAISRLGFLQLYLSSMAIAFALEHACRQSLSFRQAQRLLAWAAGLAIAGSFVNGLGSHPFTELGRFFPMVQHLHREAADRGCEVIALDERLFNPIVANAIALQPAPSIKVVNGYSGWPSPLVESLNGIRNWGPTTLQDAINKTLASLPPTNRQPAVSAKHLCRISASPSGDSLVISPGAPG